MAIEGPLIRWVADHRRHHMYSDREGDPHSPWRYGDTLPALIKGFWYAHIGWLFDEMHTNREKYTPDLMADKDLRRISALFPLWFAVSLLAPAAIGGLVSMSWAGALSAFFWASLVRVFLLHHVTWSINSICHMVGNRPFTARDKSSNFWPLAILSFGESWHNMHHADPTAARHGVLRGQIDESARVIWLFEKLGWATDVRWPKPERLAKLRAAVESAEI
jgi:stearoyl-CoA desaturase (delta-9 desaturase)